MSEITFRVFVMKPFEGPIPSMKMDFWGYCKIPAVLVGLCVYRRKNRGQEKTGQKRKREGIIPH